MNKQPETADAETLSPAVCRVMNAKLDAWQAVHDMHKKINGIFDRAFEQEFPSVLQSAEDARYQREISYDTWGIDGGDDQ